MSPDEAKLVDAAINAHGLWIGRLRGAIEAGSSDFKPEAVRADNQCDFGRWLYGNFPASLRGTPVHEEIRALHAKFHVHAAEVLRLATTGKKGEAVAAMDSRADFLRTSGALVLKLTMLKSRY
jgi:hypothetical protein